jgi:SagB-type dehydrogenase family enzyme
MPDRQTFVPQSVVALPAAATRGSGSVEEVLRRRRSVREYGGAALSLTELAQLLWAAQGVTSPDGLRTTPSAGALYPLEVFAACDRVNGLPPGIYRYLTTIGDGGHAVVAVASGVHGPRLRDLSTTQEFIGAVPLNLVFGARSQAMSEKYGERFAERFIFMELGHAAQNVHLQAEALGLGSVAIGALNEDAVQALLGTDARPLYMVSVGRRHS